jgi:hypothetical protein
MIDLPTPRIWRTPLGTPGEPYRPSNGHEGRIFEDEFCGGCELDHAAHMGDFENGCLIFARALAFSVGEEHYPSEWVIADDGYPTCTAFTPDGCS